MLIGPSARFDRTTVFRLFLAYTRFIAAAGIVQWAVQFIGIRIFSFMVTVPALKPVLVEPQFNFNPILHYGSTILRSNGFFLLEPSMFSQTLVIAVVIDYFILGRVKYLPLYLVAYMLSFSGTGALSLALAPYLARRTMTRPLHLAISYDEEVGCLGAPSMIAEIARALPSPAAVVVGEPTEMVVVSGHKGIATWNVTVTGHEAHSSLIHLGASANMVAVRLMQCLADLADQLAAA